MEPMLSQRAIWSKVTLVFCLALLSLQAFGQDSPSHRGRKYKPPPDTSHIVVQVLKKANGKPIMNAAVVFNPTKDGKDIGSLEVKTDPDGKAIIDVIPTGSVVRVQIIANGYATYAQDYQIDEASKEILVSMVRPQEQVSSYVDNTGKASSMKPGVQEPVRPTTPAPATSAPATPKQ
jgi:hypothetical protein